jgi:hypothetical protein
MAPAVSQGWIEISQLSEDGDTVVGVIHKATKCKKGRKGALIKYLVSAKSADGQWVLHVYWHQWSGFHEYALDYGGDADPWFALNGTYSNLNTPPDQPPFGGGIDWSGKAKQGRKFSIGFVPTFNQDLSAAVSVTGAIKCPKPRRKGR